MAKKPDSFREINRDANVALAIGLTFMLLMWGFFPQIGWHIYVLLVLLVVVLWSITKDKLKEIQQRQNKTPRIR